MATTARERRRPHYYDDPRFDYAHWWLGREYEHESEVMAIRRLLHGRRFGSAADIGGGFGRLSMVLADYADHVTLVDPSAQQLELSRSFLASHPAIDRRQMITSELEFPDASMDLVTMIRVMHRLPDPAPELAEVSRILRPNGYAIIESANAMHALNRLRSLLRGDRIPVSGVDIGSRGSIPCVNHHPDAVAHQLKAAGLHIRRVLSVSNLRHPLIKKVLPERVMLAAEWAMQERFAEIRFGPSMFFFVGGASLLDPGRDGRGDVDGAADRAQAVMRLLHRVRQQRPGSVALLTAGEPDPERHLDVGQAVAVGVAHLVRVDQYLEGLGFSPARGQDVDVDGCAAADGDQQQLRRGEIGAAARAQGDLAAPAVGGGELAVRDAPNGHAAVHGIIRHTHSLADASRLPEAGTARTSTSWPGPGPPRLWRPEARSADF